MSSIYDNNVNFIDIPNNKLTNVEDKLRRELSSSSGKLNVVHFNAESVYAHFRDIENSFCSTDLNIHAILISETFLKPHMDNISPNLFNLPGYTLIRNDRTYKGRGGVAIYLRQNIPFERLIASQASDDDSAEYLFILLRLPVRILLGVFYPPSSTINYFATLRSILQELRPQYHEGLVMEDFNTCQTINNSRKRDLLRVLNSVGFKILPSQITHRKPGCDPSLIDLSIVSNVKNVAKHGQLPSCFSYHDLIYVSYTLQEMTGTDISQFLLQPRPGNIIQPSIEENIVRSYRLKYKTEYNTTTHVASLLKYQKWHKVWMKHEKMCMRKTKRNIQDLSYRPRILNYLQKFLAEQQDENLNLLLDE